MPIIKSAKKRVKVAAKASVRNAKTKRALREAMKSFQKALNGGKPADIVKAEQAAMSAVDMTAKKAIMHKNKAARMKSQIAAAAKAHGVKHGQVPAKKPAAKTSKPKTAAKKPATKKTSAKK